jgi:2-C-methyl-D-erythritol 2,4-cyclodiphosphate synthase
MSSASPAPAGGEKTERRPPNTELRVGNGLDVHAFAPGRRLVLGGVAIPSPLGLAGHSDADAVAHALVDALLGAAALGDIGHYFPSTDPRWKDADSLEMVRATVALLTDRGWRVNNVDVTVVAEQPKLAPHLPAIRRALAAALAVAEDRVSAKATTTDRLGFTGRGEGLAAIAVATIAGID